MYFGYLFGSSTEYPKHITEKRDSKVLQLFEMPFILLKMMKFLVFPKILNYTMYICSNSIVLDYRL